MLDLLPMRDLIILSNSGGYDDWGLPIEKPPLGIYGNYRYNTTRSKIITDNGDEIVYSADVYLPYDTDISYDTTIQFVDELGTEVAKKPITIQHKRDVWGSPMVLRVVV